MPVNPDALVEITAFAWVPPFAEGLVRDLRPRWACEEIGLEYAERLIDATKPRPASYLLEQPWGQVPVLKDHGLADALGTRTYLAGDFSVADIAMATVLREVLDTDLISSRPRLSDYVDRCVDRPAFQRALAAQIAAFRRTEAGESR